MDYTSLTKVLNPQALSNYNESDLVRNGADIYLKAGSALRGNLNYYQTPRPVPNQDIVNAVNTSIGKNQQQIQPQTPQIQTTEQLKQMSPESFSDFSLPEDLTVNSNMLKDTKNNFDLTGLLSQQAELRNKLISSLTPSTQEQQINTELADLRSKADVLKRNYEEGFNAIEDKNIAMPFITGQQASLERRYNLNVGRLADQEKNLLSRLGLEQDARKAEKDIYETGLSSLSQDMELQLKVQEQISKQENDVFNRAMALREDSRQVLAGILESFKGLTLNELDTDTALQIQQLATRAGIPFNILSQGMDVVANQQGFENALKAGELDYKKANQGLDTQLKQLQIQEKLQSLSGEGLSDAEIRRVEALASTFESSPIVKNFIEVQTKKMGVDKLLSTGTVGGPQDVALVYDFMKSLDPTSVVRESEYQMGAKSGNLFLGALAKFNGYFKETGGQLPENVRQEFANILNQRFEVATSQYRNLKNERIRKINNITGSNDGSEYLTEYEFNPTSEFATVDEILAAKPDYLNFVYSVTNELTREGLEATDENVIRKLKEHGLLGGDSFNQDLSKSENGSSEIKKIASAIGQYESGGNYKAKGPTVTSGMYKGDNAYGKYQIMGKNIPQWSKEALGRSITIQEFLNNPQLQDQIAEYKMGNIYKQHGNLEDVASVWFSGRPLAKAGNAKDVIGTTVPKYVKSVRSIYDNLS